MPVRSLHSSVLRWPDPGTVLAAARTWAERVAATEPAVERIGIVGSYARGDWGVGSDLDVVIIVAESALPFERRAARLDTADLPVPVDLLVYTRDEWERMVADGRLARFAAEARWLVDRGLGTADAAGP